MPLISISSAIAPLSISQWNVVPLDTYLVIAPLLVLPFARSSMRLNSTTAAIKPELMVKINRLLDGYNNYFQINNILCYLKK